MKQFLYCFCLVFYAIKITPAIEIEFTFDTSDALTASLMKIADKAYTYNLWGLDSLEKKAYGPALELFQKASETMPQYSDAINNCAVVHFRKGQISRASQIWEHLIQADPSYPISYYNLGIIASEEKRFNEAEKQFKNAIEKSPTFVEPLVMLGKVHLLQSEIDQAVPFLKKAYALAPRTEEVWQLYAYTLIQRRDTVAAELILNQSSNHPYSLLVRGQIQILRGHIPEGMKLLYQARIKSNNLKIMLQEITVLYDLREFQQAKDSITAYMKRISLPSEDAFLLAGLIAKECGDLSSSQRYFERGLQLYPINHLIRYNVGLLYFHNKQFEKAKRCWQALPDSMQDPSLFYMRSLACRALKRTKEAKLNIEKALSLDNRAEYYDLLGVLLYEQGQKENAIIQFKKALAIDPHLQSAVINCALAEKMTGSITSAIAVLKKSIGECTTSCTDKYLHLSLLYYHDQQVREAIETLAGLKETQRDAKVYYQLAFYYATLALWDSAIVTVDQARRSRAFDQRLELLAGQIYLDAGKYSSAINVLDSLRLHASKDLLWRVNYLIGYAYVKSNDFVKGRESLLRSLALNDSAVAARGLLAYVYHTLNDHENAQSLWEQSVKQDPNNATLWINLGLLQSSQGKTAAALESFEKALRIAPQQKALYLNIGTVYETQKEYAYALQAYQKALTSDKRYLALFNTAMVSKKVNNQRLLKDMYACLVNEFPSSPYTKRVHIELLLDAKDTSAAIKELEQLSEKNSEDWIQLASLTLNKNDIRTAKNAMARVVDSAVGNNAMIRLNSRIAFIEGRFQEAFLLLKSLNDTSYETLYDVALAALRAGMYDEAETWAAQCLLRAKAEEKPAIYRLIGNVKIQRKKWVEAKAVYENLRSLNPFDEIAWFNGAVCLFHLNAIDSAWICYQKARSIDSSLRNEELEKRYASIQNEPKVKVGELDSLYNQAVQLQQAEDMEDAAHLYSRILESDKRYFRAWNNLGTIYGARGQVDEAIDCYEKALESDPDYFDAYLNLINLYYALEDMHHVSKWKKKAQKKFGTREELEKLEEYHKKQKKK